MQVSIKLDSDYNCQECDVKPMKKWQKSSDFPATNPTFSGKKNKYLYAATTLGSRKTLPCFPFDTVVKLDLETTESVAQTWTAGSRRFIGEPIFVPKGDEEDDGYLLVVEVGINICRVRSFFFFFLLNVSFTFFTPSRYPHVYNIFSLKMANNYG